MNRPENLRSVSVPEGSIELRIHGVSGTTPDALLKAPPVRVAGTKNSGFYRSEASLDGGLVEAYSWGGLTSGSRLTALWLFLLPFALVNVSGWMIPVARDGSRLSDEKVGTLTALGRLTGLGLSSLLAPAFFLVGHAALGLELSSERGIFGWLRRLLDAISGVPTLRLALATSLAAITLGAFHLVARAGDREPKRTSDLLAVVAVPSTPIESLWTQPFVVRSLGVMHVGMVWGVIAILSAASVETGYRFLGLTLSTWAAGLGVLAILAAVSGTSGVGVESTRGLVLIRNTALGLGFSAVLVSVLTALFADDLSEPLMGLAASGLGDPVGGLIEPPVSAAIPAFFYVGVSLVVLVIVVTILHFLWCGLGRFNSVGFVGWGVAAAVSTPSGLLLILADRSDLGDLNSIHLAAWLFAVAGLVAAIGLVWRWQPLGGGSVFARAVRIRKTVALATTVIRRVGVLLVSMLSTAVIWFAVTGAEVGFVDGVLPDPRAPWGGVIGWALLAGLLVVALHPLGLRFYLGLTLVAPIVWAVLTRVGDEAAPVGDAPALLESASQWFVDLAGFVAMIAPLIAIGWFVVRASASPGNRRLVGVFWDLANYWPRWFHPWAPAPYNDIAIPALSSRVAKLVGEGKRVIVSGHSQGAVMAIPMIRGLDQEVCDGVSLLTYGCLLDRHYRELFPRFFNGHLFDAISAQLGGRWLNLHRPTDPLGHPVSDLGSSSWPVQHEAPELGVGLLTHSDYQYSVEYQAALAVLA